jgi:Tol biopolymer transport system component
VRSHFANVLAVLLASGVTPSTPVNGQPVDPGATGLAQNLEVHPTFQPFLETMWRASPSFRRQSSRLSAEGQLRVRVLLDDRASRDRFHAHSVLKHHHDALVSADISLKPSPDAIELIAHEIEHVIEQLDGVNLRAQAGNGAVWASGDGLFETRRAIEAGRRIARETLSGSPEREGANRRVTGTVERITAIVQRDRDAGPLAGRSSRLSADGRFLAFVSSAQLVAADVNRFQDVYVIELSTGRLTLETVPKEGAPADGDSRSADISGDGRYVVFESEAGNLFGQPSRAGVSQILIRDRLAGSTSLLSATARGEAGNAASRNPVMSADGTVVAFESAATNFEDAIGMPAGSVGIFEVRRPAGTPRRLDLPTTGGQRPGQGMTPAISADGRLVAFASKADLTCTQKPACPDVGPDKNGVADIYVRDTAAGAIRRVSRAFDGGDPDGASYDPAISGDGRFVAFVSEASNLVRESGKRIAHVYVHELATGITTLISRTPRGRPANAASLRPVLSHDGSKIAFQSLASDLICEGRCRIEVADINLLWDVFVHDRLLRRTIHATTDDEGPWPDGGRTPALDAAGRTLLFASRRPVDMSDRAHDDDLYVLLVRP